MRLFTGIALDDHTMQALLSYVSSFQRGFPALRWSLPQQWHVTLQFLGETKQDRYNDIVEQLRTVHAGATEIRIGGPGFFKRAGVFHIVIEKTESLIALHRQTEQALVHCGFKPETRPYSPHITLARNKGHAPSPDFRRLRREAEKHVPIKFPAFVAHEFLLYQSFTESSGSRYEVRERFSLM
jgi:2'-5' RNA ligase